MTLPSSNESNPYSKYLVIHIPPVTYINFCAQPALPVQRKNVLHIAVPVHFCYFWIRSSSIAIFIC